MSYSGGGVYADVCARVTSSCTSDTNELDINKCFVYNEEGILSYEACRMFKWYKDLLCAKRSMQL